MHLVGALKQVQLEPSCGRMEHTFSCIRGSQRAFAASGLLKGAQRFPNVIGGMASMAIQVVIFASMLGGTLTFSVSSDSSCLQCVSIT